MRAKTLRFAAALAFLAAPAFAQEKLVVLMLGAPGSGKSTQAKKISAKYGIPSISLSDILKTQQGHGKAMLSPDKKLNKRMEAAVSSGAMVSSETANKLVVQRISQKDAANGFILDGYPFTAEDAAEFEKSLAHLHLPKPVVIDLIVPDEVALQRMEARNRADDKAGLSEPRLEDWRKQEAAILSYYPGAHKINGNQSEGQVWAAIQEVLGAR
jgi:adenylate kinase